MNPKHIILTLTALLLLPATTMAGGSPKRGVCWDESAVKLNTAHAALLAPGVSWVYNWGPDAGTPAAYGEGFSFEPMAWNAAYNASRIRQWLAAHPETRYLLGFNEPNFADQARMTPAQAAQAWPALESIAAEFGVRLVAPALNFSNSQVGGRVWNPYEWYDEFFRLLPNAKIDCLAMHCYMNWYSANTWLATEYFYTDLYNPSKSCYGKYPNLVVFLDRYKEANGHFPRMMLTEFCSWENDGAIKNADFQIDQMTQKVQMLELSDLVEGYAWFMANPSSGSAAYPYMGLFTRNAFDAPLSDLGKIYVNMSTFDRTHFYTPGELIQAKDYVGATTDDRQIRVRPNTETASELPLQIEIPAGGYPDYLIDVPADGVYRLTFHVNTSAATRLFIYVDNKKTAETNIPATAGAWADVEVEAKLSSGQHTLSTYNAGTAPLLANSLTFVDNSGVDEVVNDSATDTIQDIYTLDGIRTDRQLDTLQPGIYLVRYASGKTTKIITY